MHKIITTPLHNLTLIPKNSKIMIKSVLVLLLALLTTNTYSYTDSSLALQTEIDKHCASQTQYNLPPGRYYLYNPLIITTNCQIIGQGANFSTVLQPVGTTAAFIMDGTTIAGGWAFRNILQGFTIDGSTSDAPELIKINKTYTSRIINVFIYNQATSNGLDVTESNDIQVNQTVFYGKMNPGQSAVIIQDKTSIIFNDVDIENYDRCLKTFANSTVDLHSPYMERCVVNIEHAATGTGSINVFGGKIAVTNGHNIGLKGHNFNLYGTKLLSYNAAVLNGEVVKCFYTSYTNVKLRGVTSYPGYLTDTNCNLPEIIQ